MSDNIRYGFPKLRVNGDNVGFKTYTTSTTSSINNVEFLRHTLPLIFKKATIFKNGSYQKNVTGYQKKIKRYFYQRKE